MDGPAREGPKRPRGRPAVGRARIVEAALGVLDEEGAEALTLRAVAKRLSSSTATLYRHVEGRAELLGLVMDYLLGEADGQIRAQLGANANWDEVCRNSARISYRVMSSHNASAHLFTNTFPLGPNGLVIRERMLAALLRAGFPPMMSVNTVATISRYVVGFAMQNDATVGRSTLEDAFLGGGGDRYPATASVVHLLPRPLDEEFEFGLDLILQALNNGLPPSAPVVGHGTAV
ncbi:TetR/AcrR family transcriptional regulator [Micromonospora sp. NPDC005203]|uniref:TetR/AcrR family transcriptional regulator n=1 Tax=Micromonospora sp. NPDC005203 TaxID=3364226 RepID=UPI0036995267